MSRNRSEFICNKSPEALSVLVTEPQLEAWADAVTEDVGHFEPYMLQVFVQLALHFAELRP